MLSMHTDIVLQLSHFGISKTDAEIYLAILRMGPVTAREVSKTLEKQQNRSRHLGIGSGDVVPSA